MSNTNDEELSIPEILLGFTNNSFKDSQELLLQLLVNKSAEALAEFDEKSSSSIFQICLKKLSSSIKSSLIDLCLSLICNLTATEENSQILLNECVINESPGLSTLKPELAFVVESFLNYDSQLVEKSLEDILPSAAAIAEVNSSKIQSSTDQDQSSPSTVTQTTAIFNVEDENWELNDPWQHMSSILCNLSRIETGRKILLKQSSGYMQKLVRQIRSRNPTRRRGAVACLRTCLFENEIHWWMLHEVNVLSFIMLPIVVATPFTEREKIGMDPMLWINAENIHKKWEPNTDILIMLLECIVLLCQKRGMREVLRKRKIYPICRNLDYLQEDEGVSNLILEIVNFLMRDEEPLEIENNTENNQENPSNKLLAITSSAESVEKKEVNDSNKEENIDQSIAITNDNNNRSSNDTDNKTKNETDTEYLDIVD